MGPLLPAPPPAASLEATLLLEESEFAAFDFGLPELDVLELEPSDDPPPHPVNASAATASARTILALAVFPDFTRRR